VISQDEAKADVLRRWRELPLDQRATELDAAKFAERVHREYDFRSPAGRMLVIEGWLRNELDRMKGQ
jgi:hypothetical protein